MRRLLSNCVKGDAKIIIYIYFALCICVWKLNYLPMWIGLYVRVVSLS